MSGKTRRAGGAPRLEALEERALMAASVGPDLSAAWLATSPVKPASAVLMRFSAGTSSDQIDADLGPVGGRVVMTYTDGPDLVELPPWVNASAALGLLKASPGVVYAEADNSFHASGVHAAVTPLIPNNPSFPQEWGMTAVDATSAWGITTGTAGTIVAVLDTGIDLNNPAFAGRIWVNSKTDGSDGYAGDVNGWNFIDNTPNVQDDNSHGTHVSGILAATGNNGIGIAGINWGARIMPVKILDSQGNGTTDASISGIYFAVNHGAKVINASWGGDAFSQAFLDALNYAAKAGVVFVTAAGNESSNNDTTTTYPASYHTSNELVVAAIDQNGYLASYSNWGPTTVDLAAPGTNIYSTVVGGFDTYSGTSMATPFVTGTVALLEGVFPGLTAPQLVARVKATVKSDSALNGKMVSPGIVDPYFALINHVTQGNPPPPPAGPQLVPGATSLEDVEAALLISDNTFAKDGGTIPGYVAWTYVGVFGRTPTAGELSYYTTALQNGTSRYAFVKSLQNSNEGRLTRVARWYVDDIGATQPLNNLKSDPGVAAWAARIAAGWSDAQILNGLLTNDGRYAGLGGTNTTFVASLYPEILSRPADIPSLTYFINAMAAGASRSDVVHSFLSSTEGHNATAARLFRNDLGFSQSVAQLAANPTVKAYGAFLGGD